MRSDFAVLILTHGRAHDQVTFHELEKHRYSGKAYLIIDDLDEQRAEYERLYGDSVIVFDKREYAKRIDTMTTEDELRSVVFARNAAYDIAGDLGLRYFAMFDDDLSQFTFRYVKDGRLVSAPVTDFDGLFESMVGFLETTGVTSLNIASSGALIGGLAGVYGNGMCWNINKALVVRASDRLKFVGILNEDMNNRPEQPEGHCQEGRHESAEEQGAAVSEDYQREVEEKCAMTLRFSYSRTAGQTTSRRSAP